MTEKTDPMLCVSNCKKSEAIAYHQIKLKKAKADRDATTDWRVAMLACDQIIWHMARLDSLCASVDEPGRA